MSAGEVGTDDGTDFERARTLLLARRFEQAKKLLAPRLASNPDSTGWWQLMAAAHLGCGEHQEADDAARQAITLAPDNAELHVLRCRILQNWGENGECVGSAQAALEIEPNHVQAHLLLALALVDMEREPQRALWHAQRACERDPDSALAHRVVGLALQAQGTRRAVKQALVPLETARRLDPQDEQTFNALGLCEIRRSRAVSAVRHFVTALRLAPQTDTASHNLPLAVWCLVIRGRWWLLGVIPVLAVLAAFDAPLTWGTPAAALVHLVGAAAVVALAWWALFARILRVFPATMRHAAKAVLRRDRVVRPTWIGLMTMAIADLLVVGIPWPAHAPFPVLFWFGFAGLLLGRRRSVVRLRRMQREREAESTRQWRAVVTEPGNVRSRQGSG